jgi:hypothetical protein
MRKHLLSGGRYALGFICGVIAAFLFLAFLGWPEARQFISGDVSYVILGAFVAGAIGVGGQILAILSSEAIQEANRNASEKAGLLRALHKTICIFNTLIQVKRMGESTSVSDSVFVGDKPIMKPIFGSEFVPHFTDEDLLLPLLAGDAKLHTWMSELNNIVSNYQNILPVYTKYFNEIASPLHEGVKFDPLSKFISGEVEIKHYDLARLLELQEHMISSAYLGISHCMYIIDATKLHLRSKYGTTLGFDHPLSEDELREIRDGLEE